MGKVRRQRQKYHATLAKTPETTNPLPLPESLSLATWNDVKKFKAPENVLSNLNITFKDFKSTIADDTKSVKSFKSLKSELGIDKQMGKVDKRSLRHEFLLQKIDTLNQAKKREKLKRKREKTVITGDMAPLMDALPDLSELIRETKERRERDTKTREGVVKKRAIQKDRVRRKEHVNRVNTVMKMYGRPQFKKDPMGVIKEFLSKNLG